MKVENMAPWMTMFLFKQVVVRFHDFQGVYLILALNLVLACSGTGDAPKSGGDGRGAEWSRG